MLFHGFSPRDSSLRYAPFGMTYEVVIYDDCSTALPTKTVNELPDT